MYQESVVVETDDRDVGSSQHRRGGSRIGAMPLNSADRQIFQGRVLVRVGPSAQQREVLSWINDVDRCFLKSWFKTLAPPRIDSLSGEFSGRLLDQGGKLRQFLTSRCFGMQGQWIGKAFHGLSETSGIGYNCFRSGDTIVRKLPMRTSIEPSLIDQQPSMFIRYGVNNPGVMQWLVGEVRQVVPGILLGIGVFGPSRRYNECQRMSVLSRKITFLMQGPGRPFQPGIVDTDYEPITAAPCSRVKRR